MVGFLVVVVWVVLWFLIWFVCFVILGDGVYSILLI